MIDAQKSSEAAKTASPEDTRERILAATRELIGRKGKRGTTTREIAEIAGVNEATLFRHFGSKSGVIAECVQRYCYASELAAIVSGLDAPIEEALLILARKMNERMLSVIDIIRWSLIEGEYEEDVFAETAWRPQTATLEAMVTFFRARVGTGELRGDPTKLALTFMGLIFMRILARHKFPESELHHGDTDAALRFFIDVFLNGVRSHSTS